MASWKANKFPGKCVGCGVFVEPEEGRLGEPSAHSARKGSKFGPWHHYCAIRRWAEQQEAAVEIVASVGTLAGLEASGIVVDEAPSYGRVSRGVK